MKRASRFLSVALTALLLVVGPSLGVLPAFSAEGGAPSILRPQRDAGQEFAFPIDAINPSAATNSRGAGSPGFRGENQLVIYTSTFGAAESGANESGLEASVEAGVVRQVSIRLDAIPASGFVISGHGSAAAWMQRFVKPGAEASVDPDAKQLRIRLTPAVYLYEVDQALLRLEGRIPADADAYRHAREQAEACRAQLSQLAAGDNGTARAEMAAVSRQCAQEAQRAYYATVADVPSEFRGAWVRSGTLDPAQIQKTVDSLKQVGVTNVFLEAYYQGKTIYPSEVMAEYGLPVQHPQYKDGDPLKLWIDAAHAAGLKVHAWTQVFFAGNAQENSELYGPILQKYPQWRNVQRPHIAVTVPVPSDIEPGHYFLDPANPEVRIFLEKLLMEVVGRYDLDGLNLDYIRYPASATVGKPYYLGTTWGYTDSARRQFQALISEERRVEDVRRNEVLRKAGRPVPKAKSGYPSADPKDLNLSSPLWPRWVEWRKAQVTGFVKSVSEKARTTRPNLLVSAVVFPSTDPSYTQKLQDYPRWAREGLIQALTPIGLSPRPDWLADQARRLKSQVEDRVPVYVGIFGMYNRATPLELMSQIEAVHQAGMPGLVLFEWSRLTPEYREALREGPFRSSESEFR